MTKIILLLSVLSCAVSFYAARESYKQYKIAYARCVKTMKDLGQSPSECK